VPAPSPRRRPSDDDRVVRILLVDDVLPFIELQRNYLKRTTCRIQTARTGTQALNLCRQDPPDLAFLDADMPGMDGLAACRFLKADPVLGRIPVVIVASADRREACFNAGCDDVLVKPFDSMAFLEKVRRFVPLLERREGRIPVSCRVEFTTKSGSYVAYTRDLSTRGLFLKSPRPFAPGTPLRLVIHLPERRRDAASPKAPPVEVQGEVRRSLRPAAGSHLLPGVGVRFVDPPAEAVAAIERFIAARRAR